MRFTRLIPLTRLEEPLQRLATEAFQRGHTYRMEALAGKLEAAELAIINLNVALMFATPETWPQLWFEAQNEREQARRLCKAATPRVLA